MVAKNHSLDWKHISPLQPCDTGMEVRSWLAVLARTGLLGLADIAHETLLMDNDRFGQ